jgi:hypothetical protein
MNTSTNATPAETTPVTVIPANANHTLNIPKILRKIRRIRSESPGEIKKLIFKKP